jgi:hypothetical protein
VAAGAEVRHALRPGVADATHVIAVEAESNAAFSSYIPGAISESVSFSASGGGGVIRVAERGYPHEGEVRVLEGNGISPEAFRHPVYDHGGWAMQMTHPFLGPAVEEKEPEAVALIEAAVTTALNALF